jgi:hypothetical protein
MNTVITRTCDMFVRVRAFNAERASLFPAGSLGGELFKEVNEVVEQLTATLTTQTSGVSSVQQATSSRTVAREALHASMQAISRTARAMALDAPGLEEKFRLPRSGSDQALLMAARAFAADALPLKAEFVRHELPATFIEDLLADIADLEHAIGGQNTGRDEHVTATASIETVVERGMNAIRRLDAIVPNKFRDDPAALAAWQSARHVESSARTRKRSKSAKDSTKSTKDSTTGGGGKPDGTPSA